jgi:hypothetical protein
MSAVADPVSSVARSCMFIAVNGSVGDYDCRGQIMGAIEFKIDSRERSFDAKISRVAYDEESWTC